MNYTIWISLLLTFWIQTCFSQPETNSNILRTVNWAIGDSILIVFYQDSIIVSRSAVAESEGYSTFSSSDGALMLYTDGRNLYDSKTRIADNILGDKSSNQSSLFWGSDSLIFLATTTDIGRSPGLNITTLKPNLNGYDISNKKILTPVCEAQSIVFHANRKSYWLAVHKFKSFDIYFFIIDRNGNFICPTINQSKNYFGDEGYNAIGNLLFSPSGNLLSLNTYLLKGDFSANGESELYKFNSETGHVELMFSTGLTWLPLKAAFSPDESKLYISERGRDLLQYDLDFDNQDSFRNSMYVLWSASTAFSNGALQLSPNGRIYVAIPDSSFLAAIESPNKVGKDCGLNLHALDLNEKKLSYGLPNFNASYFYTPAIDFAYEEDCRQHRYKFEGRDTLHANAFKWLFEKAGYRDSASIKNCMYQFPDTGKWRVSHIASNGGRKDTVTKTLTIRPKWREDMLGRDTFYCARQSPGKGEPFKLTLKTPPDMHCIHWMGEEPNLDEDKGPIVDYNHFHTDSFTVDTAGVYFVRVTNKTFCQAWDTITIEEKPLPATPQITGDSEELSSTLAASLYRWFLNDTFLLETSDRIFNPTQNGYYQVQLVSEYGCESQRSDSFLYDKAGVEELQAFRFKVYPNPSDGNITVEFEDPGSYEIEVFDMAGKLVLSKETHQVVSTNLHITQPASYLIRITSASGEAVVQVVQVR